MRNTISIPNMAALLMAAGLTTAGASGLTAQEKPPPTEAMESTSPDQVLDGVSIVLRVDGMSCPFCAYGLEKRLREIESIDDLLIKISDGTVQIRLKDGEALADEALTDAVDKAGFTLREVSRIDR